jgi:Cdc6-like AAA superfamily ATPase
MVVPGGLPAQPTSLIGREREVAQVRALLLSPETRLLTLVGTGGTGKTRLALAVAADLVGAFEHRVTFVDLCAAPSPAEVVPTIAHALSLRDLGTRLRLDRVRQYLATPFFQKYEPTGNAWAIFKTYLDAASKQTANPVVAKYTGRLAGADVFTFDSAFAVFDTLRIDAGVLGPFGDHP